MDISERNDIILREFHNGDDRKTLSERYEITTVRISQILISKGVRKISVKDKQKRDEYITEKHAEGQDVESLAQQYNLSKSRIWQILGENGIRQNLTKNARKWRDGQIFESHLAGENTAGLARRFNISIGYVTEILRDQDIHIKEDILGKHQAILELIGEGKSNPEIADKLGESLSCVQSVARKHGAKWKPKKLHCLICGKEFNQTTHNNLCCSDECMMKHRVKTLQTINADLRWKKCEECGKRYRLAYSNLSTQRFCGFHCAQMSRFKNQRDRNNEIWWYREIQDMTFSRIGEIFGISPETARHHYINQRKTHNEASLAAKRNSGG